MTAHSKPPWKWDGRRSILDAYQNVIAKVFCVTHLGDGPNLLQHAVGVEEQEANCVLIDSAPSLLTVCVEAKCRIDEMCRCQRDESSDHLWNAESKVMELSELLQKAIASATLYRFFNEDDPQKPVPAYDWPFVYLHGDAESLMMQRQTVEGWSDRASDLFVADAPMPKHPGNYRAMLYGKELFVVVADSAITQNHLRSHLKGRAVLNEPGSLDYRHAMAVDAWR